MPSCEKCWNEANRNSLFGLVNSMPEEYSRLIKINKCTPEEQAGEDATTCDICDRKTVHQYARICMICGKDFKEPVE